MGKPTTVYHVNEKLLRANSGFFDAALKKEWREGQTRKVELPDHESEHFNVWLNWLHGRQIVLGGDKDENDGSQKWFGLVRSYQLGDVLLDADFKDALVDTFLVMTVSVQQPANCYMVPDFVLRRELYATTSPTSKLRQLLVDRIARCPNAIELLSEDDDSAFLYDFAKSQAKIGTVKLGVGSTVVAANACEYHEHGDGACYRTKYANIVVHRG